MKKTVAVLIVMLLAGVAGAIQTTYVFGDNFAGLEAEVKRVGPISLNGTFSVDYFGDEQNYAGPKLKCHFTKPDAKVDPYIGASYLIRSGDFDDEFYVLEAGVDVYVTEKIGIGLAYVSADNFYRDDLWMIRVPIRW